MAVFENGIALPGTVRRKTPRKVVLKRRKNRRLWREGEEKWTGRSSPMYGNRRLDKPARKLKPMPRVITPTSR